MAVIFLVSRDECLMGIVVRRKVRVQEILESTLFACGHLSWLLLDTVHWQLLSRPHLFSLCERKKNSTLACNVSTIVSADHILFWIELLTSIHCTKWLKDIQNAATIKTTGAFVHVLNLNVEWKRNNFAFAKTMKRKQPPTTICTKQSVRCKLCMSMFANLPNPLHCALKNLYVHNNVSTQG